MPERLFEPRRTTFDTPRFRGIEFIEVEAKTIINHVPGNYLPFNWSKKQNAPCPKRCRMFLAAGCARVRECTWSGPTVRDAEPRLAHRFERVPAPLRSVPAV